MSKKLAALQDNATATDGALGVHELFELASPSGSLVGFSIKGELSSGGREWEKGISQTCSEAKGSRFSVGPGVLFVVCGPDPPQASDHFGDVGKCLR